MVRLCDASHSVGIVLRIHTPVSVAINYARSCLAEEGETEHADAVEHAENENGRDQRRNPSQSLITRFT